MTKRRAGKAKSAQPALEQPETTNLATPLSVRALSAMPILNDKAEWTFPWIEDAEEQDRVRVYEHCREGLRVADWLLRSNRLGSAADTLAQRIAVHDSALAIASMDSHAGTHMASMLYLMAVHRDSGCQGLLPPPSASCRELLRRHYSIVTEGRGAVCSLRPLTLEEINRERTSWSMSAQPEYILTLNDFTYPPPKLSEVVATLRQKLKGKVDDDIGGHPPADLLFLSLYRYSMGKRRMAVSHGKSFVDELLACRPEMTETAARIYAGCLGYEKPMIADKTWYSGVRSAGTRISATVAGILEKVVKT